MLILAAAPHLWRIYPPAALGWLALVILLRVVDRGQLHRFAPYCWILGAITLFLAWLG